MTGRWRAVPRPLSAGCHPRNAPGEGGCAAGGARLAAPAFCEEFEFTSRKKADVPDAGKKRFDQLFGD